MAVEPVTQVNAAASTDPTSTSADADVQQAFAEGIVKFMGVMLQSAQADIPDAINDTTSTPDAPG